MEENTTQETNQTVQETQVLAQAPVVVSSEVPQPQVQPHSPQPPQPSHNKTLLLLFGALVGIVAVVLLYFTVFAPQQAQRSGYVPPFTNPLNVAPTAVPTPRNEEEAAEAVDVGDIENDMQELNRDSQQL